MSVAALDATAELGAREAAVVAPTELSPRTRALLREPIVPTLLRMAWPNVLVMVAQAATGLIETWFGRVRRPRRRARHRSVGRSRA